MDRGAWQATVQRVTKSWTRLCMYTCTHPYIVTAFHLNNSQLMAILDSTIFTHYLVHHYF